LFWLFIEQGGRFATSAALGSLHGTGLSVLLGAIFARLAMAWAAPFAALVAWVAIAGVAALTWKVTSLPAGIALAALGTIALGRFALPPPPTRAAERRASAPAPVWPSIVVAGVMSFLVTELSRHVGARLCGLLAALPLMAMFALQAGWRRGGAPLMLRVLLGYVDGMTAKAAFLGTLACAWALGAGAWAWALALAAAGAALAAQHAASVAARGAASSRETSVAAPDGGARTGQGDADRILSA
jgi:hypothetical protein